jgi:hypothetical protein
MLSKINTQDLIRRFESMGLAMLHGAIIDIRKLEDYRRELVRRGINLEKEKQKRLVRLK